MWILSQLLFSRLLVSDSLWPHGLQHARLPCPSPSPGVSTNSCPLSQWYHPTISSSVIPFFSCPHFPSIRIFSNESVLCIRWPKYWSFSFSISLPSEYSGLISFRVNWFDLLAVQGTLKSLLQHHSSKASILQHSVFFMVQLSHPYMTTRKTITLTRWTFVSKGMSVLFNMSSRSVIVTLPASFNFMATVTIHSDFRALENKVCHCFHCFPIYLLWSDGTGCHDLCFLNVELNAHVTNVSPTCYQLNKTFYKSNLVSGIWFKLPWLSF